MNEFGTRGSRVLGLGHAQPRLVVTNDDLAEVIDTDDAWIRARTGIVTRHVVSDEESVTTLAIDAARMAVADAGIATAEVDLVVLASTTTDSQCPNTAGRIAQALGLNGPAILDINTACSAFEYAVAIADQSIKAGTASCAIVVGAETLSTVTDRADRSTAVLTADGAGAMVLRASEPARVGGVVWGSVPELTDAVRIEGTPRHFHQEGRSVFRWATTQAAAYAHKVVNGAGLMRTNIEKIGGTIEMQSQAGRGTSFTIKIPLTLAIVSALVVESAKERFAIPQINVVELVRASPHAETRIEMINTSPVLRLRDRLMPLVSLRQLLRQEPSAEGMDGELFIVVAQVGTYSFGIIVDRVFDTEEIVVKPVSPLLRDIPFYSGNTILGDGSVIMILDPNGMAAQTGQVQMGQSEAAARPADAVTAETARMSFLVFRANGGEFKAVPLALVARLEEINLSAVERTRGRHVVQYRNHLMPLVPYDPAYQWKTEGKQPVLVFSEGERSMGLVVDEIVDVVADVMKVQLDANEPGLIGSAVIGGKAMDIIDVGSYLTQAFADWFTEEPERAAEAKAQPRNALIIDPSAFVRELLTPHLAGSGWHVATADNAADAQRLTDAERVFGLVVVGLATPGLDAPAFARRLRENPRWDGTRLAALAECIDEDEAFQLRGAGFHALLAKSNWPALVSDLHLLLTDGLPAETPAEARPGESRGAGHGNGAAKGNGAGAKMEAPAPARNEAARGRRVNGRGAAAA